MTEKTISAEQVAILAERVDTLLLNYSELKGLLLAISQQQSTVSSQSAVLQERLVSFDANQRRLFQLSDEHAHSIKQISSELKVHSWTWKLVGSVAVSSLGLVGWAYTELRSLQGQDNRHENRLSILEFIVGGRASPAPKSKEGTTP
ncbi:MAG: hypothetical protein V4843_02870 [Pseudomonadota bacterium]|jgi:hypothetical protein|uniref:hypothetical protein n=1 Tax=Acidovorax facilis TaxID=12917 RepID=UPI0008CD0CC0|nr:MAG: hypothetical protein A3C40_24240 [Burkholderiales bacterium RIFCSPHIGHO2_02_FULL_64_19]